jgi:hypothetical protein
VAELVGQNLDYAGRRLVLPAEGGAFGRDPRNHLVLAHPSVSSLHGVFRVDRGALILRDQQSTNGTRINGREVSEATVFDGDTVEIGDILFQLHAPEFPRLPLAAAPAPAPVPTPVAAAAPPLPLPAPPAAPIAEPTDFLRTPSLLNTAVGGLLFIAVLVAIALYLGRLAGS